MLAFCLVLSLAQAAEIALPGESEPAPRRIEPRGVFNMLEYLKSLPGGYPPEDMDVEAINQAYNSGKRDESHYAPYQAYQGPPSSFAQTAKECGEAKQRQCSPKNFGGRTMCGRSVAFMIKCMAPAIGAKDECDGNCGNGKDFVNCGNGQMTKCGYTKLDVNDPKCKMAGAVVSYAQSETPRGKIYGHVEFLCGDSRYCSVYDKVHDGPWPRNPPDACWYPGGGKGAS